MVLVLLGTIVSCYLVLLEYCAVRVALSTTPFPEPIRLQRFSHPEHVEPTVTLPGILNLAKD